MRRKRKTGAVRSKKKVIDGIEFSSSLEAYTYSKLKEAGIEFGYESETYQVLPSFKYDGTYLSSSPKKKELTDKTGKTVRAVTYTPDFVAKDGSWIIETKGFVPSQHSFPLRWKMFLTLMSQQGSPAVYLPKNQSQVDDVIEHIKQGL